MYLYRFNKLMTRIMQVRAQGHLSPSPEGPVQAPQATIQDYHRCGYGGSDALVKSCTKGPNCHGKESRTTAIMAEILPSDLPSRHRAKQPTKKALHGRSTIAKQRQDLHKRRGMSPRTPRAGPIWAPSPNTKTDHSIASPYISTVVVFAQFCVFFIH